MASVFAAGGARAETQGGNGFEAKMVTTIGGHTNVSYLKVKGAKLRVEVARGRTFSTMVADYRTKKLWLLAPTARQYLTQDVEQMSQAIPHFFHPAVVVAKTKMGEELIDGMKAIKYSAVVSVPGMKRTHDGFLWEAAKLPGYPLRWEDPEYRIVLEWKAGRLTDLDDALFTLPEGYTTASLPKQAQPNRHQGQHRRRQRP